MAKQSQHKLIIF